MHNARRRPRGAISLVRGETIQVMGTGEPAGGVLARNSGDAHLDHAPGARSVFISPGPGRVAGVPHTPRGSPYGLYCRRNGSHSGPAIGAGQVEHDAGKGEVVFRSCCLHGVTGGW